ncbi:MAG: LPS export ABC transporter permease LptG [Gammaproteobacteria bacterium]|nr:LPS export ABC transporter permease LptG [Gammaproteobacteria bacterium]
MNIIRGYLSKAILGAAALVLGVLVALGGFIEFVGQLDKVGTGGYGIAQALVFTLLHLPDRAFVMLPIAVLLGGLVGLGSLAAGSEIIALRAAGASPVALARGVLATGTGLVLLTLVLGLYLSPPLKQYARQYRAFAMEGAQGLAGMQSAWVRDGDVILNLSQLGDPGRFGGVYLFRLGAPGRLQSMARADSASIGAGREWTLDNFVESRFVDGGVSVRSEHRFAETSGLSPELVGLMVVRPESLDGLTLWRYSRYLRSNGLDARHFEVELWQRIASSVAVAPMCVLALVFAFGALRRAGTGARMVIGVVIGLAYFLISRGLADSAEVYNLDPLLAGWLPTLLLVAVTLLALLRIR